MVYKDLLELATEDVDCVQEDVLEVDLMVHEEEVEG